MNKIVTTAAVLASVLVATPVFASAHVIITPAQTTIGSTESFTTAVPNETQSPVTGIRIIIPSGLKYTTPFVKTGWNIDIKKTGETVTEINWTGGEIPVGQRDAFLFTAQVPSSATVIMWKAYETHRDGTIQAWDQPPKVNAVDNDTASSGPYSETKVINDLTSNPPISTTSDPTADNSSKVSAALALGAVGAVALLQKRK
jgi:uncharacterized protein YcnI